MPEQTTSQKAAIADPTLRRSIQSKFFISQRNRLKYQALCIAAVADNKPAPEPIVLGSVVGGIFEVEERKGTLPNGDPSVSLCGIGDFQAVCYDSGEVADANAAYLPGYYLKTIRAMLAKGATAVDVACEIVLEPTGKEIPIQYSIRPLIARRSENVVERLKRELQTAGRLKGLPAPVAAMESQRLLAGEVRQVGDEPAEADEPDPEGEEHKGRKRA